MADKPKRGALGALLMGSPMPEDESGEMEAAPGNPVSQEEAENEALREAFAAVKADSFEGFAEALRAFVDIRTGGED